MKTGWVAFLLFPPLFHMMNPVVGSSPYRIELRALGPIPEGQELTVSYVDFLNLSGERQKKLMERYHFECACQHCSRRLKDDLMMAAAEGKVRRGEEE